MSNTLLKQHTNSKPIRIATVKATGERYVVINIDFQQDFVHCWGEVESHAGRRTRHNGKKRFPLADVEVKTVAKTDALVRELFEQAVQARKRSGDIVTGTRTNNPTIIGRRSPAFIEAARELGVDLAEASPSDIRAIKDIIGDAPAKEEAPPLTDRDRAAMIFGSGS